MKHEVENKYLVFKKSKIHNVGAYAARDIRKGTRIIEYIGQPITKKKAAAELQDGNGYVFTINKFFDIDGSVRWNPARYINHGCDANAESDVIEDRVWILATRTIRKGEEVLYNYNYDLVDAFDNPCRCGAENCVGYIVDNDYWPKLRKLIEKRARRAKKKSGNVSSPSANRRRPFRCSRSPANTRLCSPFFARRHR